MLQQTRVETVKGYYARFLKEFPNVEALSSAPLESVLKVWEGLGYYSRARNLHKAAQVIMNDFSGAFPSTYEDILSLPGIGPYTAGAIASIAFGIAVPAIDGNVYRVASRVFGIREDIGLPSVQKAVRELVQFEIPSDNPGDFNQALMELGATMCSPGTPDCSACPLREQCSGFLEGDAELLPIHEKKVPPKHIPLGVCLLSYNNRILVAQRTERMLEGLWVFFLIEGETSPTALSYLLGESGLSTMAPISLGQARHVFTHRVWDMELYHIPLKELPCPGWLEEHHARMVSRNEMLALPFPTAMKAALDQALALTKQ